MTIQVGKWPAESPDVMPIEQTFGHMKMYLRKKVKPKNLEQLVAGIEEYVSTITEDLCRRWIRRAFRMAELVVLRKEHPVRGRDDTAPEPEDDVYVSSEDDD